MMPASIKGPAWGFMVHWSATKSHIGSQGMSGYYSFCVPTVHPIASTGPTTETNITALIPPFFLDILYT